MYLGTAEEKSAIDNKSYKHFSLDVSNEKVKDLFSQIRKSHEGLDILINNAGIASMNTLYLQKLKQLEKIFDTNLIGTFLFCREASKANV